MSSRKRGPRQWRDRDQVSRLGSLRMVLVFLTVIPSLGLLGLWGLSTAQLAADWQKLVRQDELDDRSAGLARDVTMQLQEERRLTGRMLAAPNSSRDDLQAQRNRTDDAVRAFRDSTDIDLSGLPHKQLRDSVTEDRESLARLEGIRAAVDQRTITDDISVQTYTGLIEANLAFFEALGHADNGELVAAYKPLTDLMWSDEMLSREDAVLTYSWAADEFRDTDRSNLSQWIGTQHFLIESEINPRVTHDERVELQDLKNDGAWDTKEMVESALIGHHPTDPDLLPWSGQEWRHAAKTLKPQFVSLISHRTQVVDDVTADAVWDLKKRMLTYAAICLGTVIVVIAVNVVLTNSLRRRILALRDEAARLETELPSVMARLRRGEDVDVENEVREVRHGHDEMGKLGQALNLARRTAVETAVRETEQHRGFQRMLQRIARRTQLLIGLQLKKLDEMERRQEDPEILEGLFDLDHLTSRLRRYEENLVVLGGGQPQRRWRRPVRVVDVLRAALGEVQDYRRISIEVGQEVWLSGRAVGPLVHIIAELMENAAAFSRPPNPVDARATLVGRGLAVEVEDRGLGMEAEDYDAVNRMMAEPPELDVVARAEDARLGLYVVSRLAAGLGLTVEFRPSVYGGTRVIVMVPADLVADLPEGSSDLTATVPGSEGVPAGVGGRHRGPARDAAPASAVARTAPARHAAVSDHGGAKEQVEPARTGSGRERRDGPGVGVPRPRDPYTEHARDTEHARAEAPETRPAAESRGVPPTDAGHHREAGHPTPPDTARHEEPERSRPDAGRQPGDALRPGGDGLRPSGDVLRPNGGAASGRQGGRPAQDSAGGPLPGLPARSRGRALEALTASGALSAGKGGRTGPQKPEGTRPGTPPVPTTDDAPNDAPNGAAHQVPQGPSPLPKRVRQANLAPGLKEPPRSRRSRDDEPPDPQDGTRGARSGATIGAFQRQSRLARSAERQEGKATPGDATDTAPDSRSNHTEDAP